MIFFRAMFCVMFYWEKFNPNYPEVCRLILPAAVYLIFYIALHPNRVRVYSHRTPALTLAPTLASALGMNTLGSIAPITPSISFSLNASGKNQMGSGSIQKCQC